MTRDRGYPDWLLLSALLRLLRSGYHSAKYIYMFWLCLASGYVKIIQPVAMCSYFRNKTRCGSIGTRLGLDSYE